MTFLLDHDTPDDISYTLEALGHKIVRLREVLPIDATDPEVLAHAHTNQQVLITCNRDDFLALAGNRPHAGMIILVRRRTRTAERSALVRLLDSAGESGIRDNINFA